MNKHTEVTDMVLKAQKPPRGYMEPQSSPSEDSIQPEGGAK